MRVTLLYLVTIVLANLAIAHFGPRAAPVVGFLAIGLDLTLRDTLHDRWSRGRRLWPRMLLLICTGGLLAALFSPGAAQVALASAVAFTVASGFDAWVYAETLGVLRKRDARITSNVCGAAVDSLLFPTIAFGSWLPGIVLLQFIAKALGGTAWAFVLQGRRST